MKKQYKTKEEIPEADRKFYALKNGVYVLVKDDDADDADDADDEEDDDAAPSMKAKLAEMRRNNIKLMKQNKELMDKLGSIDMDAYTAGQEALSKLADAEERELMSKGKLTDVLDRRVRTMKEAHDKELKKIRDEAAKERERAERSTKELREAKVAMVLSDTEAAMKVRVRPGARKDLKARAYEALNLDEDGNVVGFQNGEPRMNAEGKPFTARDFFLEAFDEAPHLFEDGTGVGGAGGPKKSSGGSGMGTLEVDSSDQRAFGQNLEKIARGTLNVRVKGI